MVHFPPPSKAINSGSTLFWFTASLLRHSKPTRSGALLPLPETLVMSFSSSSPSSSSSSSSSGSSTTEPLSVGVIQMFPPVEEFVRADEPEGAADRLDSLEQSSHLLGLDWVDPKVIGFTFVYLDGPSISSVIGNHRILKSDASNSILAIDYCQPTICMDRSPLEGPFFFLYSCLFSDLHVAFPFDDFTMDVLQTLNVAPFQLHWNTWASLQTFHLICDMFRLSPTPTTFLSYYTSHTTDPVSWLSLISRRGNTLFSPYTTSYKNFKGKFFKLFVEPEGMGLFFDGVDRSKFPLHWTRNPTRFKEWLQSTPSAKEQKIYSLLTTSQKGSLHENCWPCSSLPNDGMIFMVCSHCFLPWSVKDF